MTNFDQKEIEKKWQKIWKEKKVFEPKVDLKKDKFFGTVPFPYANSALHIGHGRTFTSADIFLRFERLLGKNVLFPMAFHISGTPVLAVADGIARGDKKQIKITSEAIGEYVKDKKEQKRILDSFSEPMNIADFFSSKIEETFDSVGLSIDWSRQFTTGDDIYKKFIEWQYKKLYEAGILIQGKYPILYSVRDGNAVGEDDIKDGDIDKVAISQMSVILFKFSDEDCYLAASTLRPETIFGVTNLWINPKESYLKVKAEGKMLLVSKGTFDKLRFQVDDVKIVSEHKGEEFAGKIVIAPIVNRKVPVVRASFVDCEHATGVVYSVPAHAPFDYVAFKDAQKRGEIKKDAEIFTIIDVFDKKSGKKVDYDKVKGPAGFRVEKTGIKNQDEKNKLEEITKEIYKEEFYFGKLNGLCDGFANVSVRDIKDGVRDKLVELGLAFVFYETSRKAFTRSGDRVIVANLAGQWFLDYSSKEVKDKALKLLSEIKFLPERLRQSQEGYLMWVQKRPCARKRGIGTALVFDRDWIIEPLSDSTIYQMFYLIAGILNAKKIDDDKLSSVFFDYVLLGKGDVKKVSLETGISSNEIGEMKKQVDYWRNVDFRYTAPPHMSNHLSFLIYHYALIFPHINWPKNITIGGLLIKDGEKISKSKGNGIPLIRVGELYGADLYRLYVAIGANYEAEMDFRDDEVYQLEKKFNRWKELILLAKDTKKKKYADFSGINKWLISKFYMYAKNFFEIMPEMKVRDAYVGIFYEFLNDLMYHERRTSEKETLEVLKFVATDYIKVMSPVVPHVCEELYGLFGGKGFVSLESFSTDCDKFIDERSLVEEAVILDLVSNVSRIKESKNLKTIGKIKIVQAGKRRFLLFDKLKKILGETRDFKTIFEQLGSEFGDEKKFIGKFVPKTIGCGLSNYLPRVKEREVLEGVVDYLKKEFGADVVEITNCEDINLDSVSIYPGKVGIFFE